MPTTLDAASLGHEWGKLTDREVVFMFSAPQRPETLEQILGDEAFRPVVGVIGSAATCGDRLRWRGEGSIEEDLGLLAISSSIETAKLVSVGHVWRGLRLRCPRIMVCAVLAYWHATRGGGSG